MPKGPSMRVATLWMQRALRKRSDRIVELHALGLTWQEIADIVGLSRWSVRQIYAAESRLREEAEQYRRTNAGL